MGRPGPVLLFLYIDTYFRIQGLFIKHNHIISNLCFQNIFSMTKFIFATKAETYSLHYSWIWVRKIGGSFNWFCSRDQLVKLGIQYEDIFVRLWVRECQQSWEVWNMFQGTRKSLFIRSTMHRFVVNGHCVNIFMYSCWPALLHLLHHGTIGLWWRSPIYIIDNSSHSTAVCTLAIVMLNSRHTASPVQSVNSDPSSVLQFWHQFWKAH